MVDILNVIQEFFHTTSIRYIEDLNRVIVDLLVKGDQLPSIDQIIEFPSFINSNDKLQMTVDQETRMVYKQNMADWEGEYKGFLDAADSEYNYQIQIVINKGIGNLINIYNWESTWKYLCSTPEVEILKWFSRRFHEKDHVEIIILDKGLKFANGKRLAVHHEGQYWKPNISDFDFNKIQSAGTFLDRNTFQILPEYFDIESYGNADEIKRYFDSLRNILAYIYLSSCAYFKGEKLILQMCSDMIPTEYSFEKLGSNDYIYSIYQWVFSEGHAIDKAVVARNVIARFYSKDITLIDGRALPAICSNYELSQKRDVEHYVELREKLSDFVLETNNKVWEITKDIIDGLRNNFLGVITFLISLILTDSIDIEKWTETKAPKNVIYVCTLFVYISIIYMIINIIIEKWQWNRLKKEYNDIQSSFRGMLVESDINQALNNNVNLKDSRKELLKTSIAIYIAWVLLIIIMAVFVSELKG